MINIIYSFFFRLAGWRLVGDIPVSLSKSLIIVAPHESWFDFPVGLFARAILKTKISFLGKAELFNGSFGFFFRWLGGTPVDRFSNNGMVGSVVDLYRSKDYLHIALSPEGTRKPVSKLRTGFYYITLEAQIPIIMVVFDYPNKKIILREPFYISGNIEEDLKAIANYYNQFEGVKKEWIQNYLQEEVEGEKR
jgi:1-acyl-sn-glycerol-3-phosphate acyltransferase